MKISNLLKALPSRNVVEKNVLCKKSDEITRSHGRAMTSKTKLSFQNNDTNLSSIPASSDTAKSEGEGEAGIYVKQC
jgi:hypothetical protein